MTVETARVGRSIQKYLRISPRKVRPVLNTIRSQSATRAINILRTSDKKAARLILTGLKSALANAKVLKLDEAKLYVSEAKADGGPILKRFLPRSMGRADRILKRTTHITVIVKEGRKDVNEVKSAAKKEEVKEVKTKEPKAKKAPAAKPKTTEKKKEKAVKKTKGASK